MFVCLFCFILFLISISHFCCCCCCCCFLFVGVPRDRDASLLSPCFATMYNGFVQPRQVSILMPPIAIECRMFAGHTILIHSSNTLHLGRLRVDFAASLLAGHTRVCLSDENSSCLPRNPLFLCLVTAVNLSQTARSATRIYHLFVHN